MPIKIKDSVAVITGASSGIGRATALELARRGASLVLGARRLAPLHDLVSECEAAGTRAIAVKVDVTDAAQVGELARRAVEEFGHIDVWVNNAGVTIMGRFEEAPPDVYQKVIETNLFGTIHGSRAALSHFREQRRGVLINMSSMVGKAGYPYASAYVASKFGIRGFSESLRQELLRDDDIHVCTVMPGSVDTPLFQHAANYTGQALQPPPPIYSADKVAGIVAGLIEKPRAEVLVGRAPRVITRLRRLAPRTYDRLVLKQVENEHLQDRPEAATAGNVTEPMAAWTDVSGGWKKPKRRAVKIAAISGLALLVPATAAFMWLRAPGRAAQLRKQLRQLRRLAA